MFCLYGHRILPIYKRFQLPIYWYLFSDHIVTWFRAQSSIGFKKGMSMPVSTFWLDTAVVCQRRKLLSQNATRQRCTHKAVNGCTEFAVWRIFTWNCVI